MKAVTSILKIRPLLPVKAFIPFSILPAVIAGIFFFHSLKAQNYISADPLRIKYIERKQFVNNPIGYQPATFIRPFFISGKNAFQLKVINENYFNNGLPNQENMDIRYFGKGRGHFLSVQALYLGKYMSFIFEPYQLTGQNKPIAEINRGGPFTVLNDYRIISASNFTKAGLRQAALFFHWKGFGVGYGKLNQWWGGGQHTSIAMTNNTAPLTAYHIGTIKELKWKNLGFMGKYVFSQLNEYNDWRAIYYTGLTLGATYYGKTIVSIGLSRNYLSGGFDVGVPWRANDAAQLVFEGLFVENKEKLIYTIDGHDPFDQTIEGFFSMTFPEARLKLFIELGINDHRQNLVDFISQPDHAMGTIIGFRKYGLFGNENYYFGFEYLNLARGKFWGQRATPNFYERGHYNHFSYERRRWGAHSGSDSDDLLIELGYMSNNISFIPRFNFERHGIIAQQPAEVKMEIGIEASYKWNSTQFIFIYESENARHLGFPQDNVYAGEISGKRRIQTAILRIEYLLK